MLLGAIQRCLARHGVSRRGESVVLVACSGGADSVALAHAAVTLLGARRVVVGHVDHAQRPDAGEDLRFVEQLARALGARFAAARLEPGPPAEARLRRLRYRALAQLARAAGARFVLTAHTADDQAETVLLALVRAARPEALVGIRERRGRVLRPMLEVSRRAARAYLERHRLEHREDPSNREPRFLRNRIRKELLPLLESRYRAGMVPRLCRLARRLGETRVPGRADIPSALPEVAWSEEVWSGGAIPDGRSRAAFDADRIEAPRVRPLAAGDRIQPFGMGGRRKVRDLLREAGVPAGQRAGYPVVEAAGQIVWVPGVARSAAALVGPLTRRVWVFWIKESWELHPRPGRVTLKRRRGSRLKQSDRVDEPQV